MEYSYVDGQRREPEPGLTGVCDLCGAKTVSKCGNVRIHHWAHWRRQNCDPWWENETEWHRAWKRQFPPHWREVSVESRHGERHRADVKTDSGCVIEIQHSSIKLDERRIREEFYNNMLWVIDGLRLPSFWQSFDRQLSNGQVLENSPIELEIRFGNCSILKTWADSAKGVYIDFGNTAYSDERFEFACQKPVLWRLNSVSSADTVKVSPVWHENFIDCLLNGRTPEPVLDPNLEVTISEKAYVPSPTRVRNPENERRESESLVDYSMRILGISFDETDQR